MNNILNEMSAERWEYTGDRAGGTQMVFVRLVERLEDGYPVVTRRVRQSKMEKPIVVRRVRPAGIEFDPAPTFRSKHRNTTFAEPRESQDGNVIAFGGQS